MKSLRSSRAIAGVLGTVVGLLAGNLVTAAPPEGIDFPSAIACYQALGESAHFSADTPPGYVAAPGKIGKASGALLFTAKGAHFFAGVTPSGDGDFMEFWGKSPDEFVIPLEKGRPVPRAQAAPFLSQRLIALMKSLHAKLTPIAPRPATQRKAPRASETPMLSADTGRPLKKEAHHKTPTRAELERYAEISLRRDAAQEAGKPFHPTPEEAKILEEVGTPHARGEQESPFNPWDERERRAHELNTQNQNLLSDVDRHFEALDANSELYDPTRVTPGSLGKALDVCTRVKGDSQVSELASQLRRSLMPASGPTDAGSDVDPSK